MAQIRSASAELIAFFETGDIPTSDNFSDLILSTAVYDGSLPNISGSAISTGSFGIIETGKIHPLQAGNSITISASLNPQTSLQHNLGTNTLKFKELHLQTASIDVFSSSIIPVTGSIYSLGSTSNQFSNIFADGISTLATASIDIVSSSLIPREDDTLDLGSSDREFRDLFLDGTAHIDTINNGVSIPGISGSVNISGSIIPLTTNDYDLGSSTAKWKDLHVSGTANIGTLSISSLSNGVSITGISSSTQVLELSGSLIPFAPELTGSIYDLGTSAKTWQNLFLNGTASIALAEVETGSFGFVSSSLVPFEDSVFNLGSSSLQWNNLHLAGTASIALADITKNVITTASISKVSSSLEPDATDTYSLGNSTLQWKSLNVKGTSSLGNIDSNTSAVLGTSSFGPISSSFIPDSNNAYNLGSTTNKWSEINTVTSNIEIANINTASIDRLSSGLNPTFNRIHSLGSDQFQFKTVHSATASISNLSSSLEPNADNTFDLGSSAAKFRNIFISQTASIGKIGDENNLVNIHSNDITVGNLIPTGSSGNINIQGNLIPLPEDGSSEVNLGIGGLEFNTLFVTDITASGTIEANKLIVAQFTASQIQANAITGSNQFGSSSTDVSSFSGSISAVTNITASGGISASGDLIAGAITANGFIQSNGMGNSSTISTNTTIPEGFNVALFTSPSNPSITINSGISYTVSSNADVSIISLSNFF